MKICKCSIKHENRSNLCKVCLRISHKKWRDNNPEKVKASQTKGDIKYRASERGKERIKRI